MKVDFKKPKYVIPIIVLPFLCLLNYGSQSFTKNDQQPTAAVNEIQSIGDVSERVKNTDLNDKLNAYRNRYKEGIGHSGMGNLKLEVSKSKEVDEKQYNVPEKHVLDSIDQAFNKALAKSKESNKPANRIRSEKPTYNKGHKINDEDEDLAKAISQLNNTGSKHSPNTTRYDDPMVLFREQMAIIDSVTKANDPEHQEQLRREEMERLAEISKQNTLNVTTANNEKHRQFNNLANASHNFNTIKVKEEKTLIKAIIDEDIEKGTVGARLRIRLLEDILVGKNTLEKGSYLYALIEGFEGQRVKLKITSVMIQDNVYPINLAIYDHDGMEGLYVPASAFREFSKDLGSGTSGSVNVQMQQDPSTASQLYMSSLQKMFTSTSQAVAKSIRQNKVNVKYGSLIYLIDPDTTE